MADRLDGGQAGSSRAVWLIPLAALLNALYWLTGRLVPLGVFIAGALAWYGGQWLRFCQRCRVESRPFSRVKVEG